MNATNICISCLSVLDETNFSDEMIEKYFDTACRFVYQHFETSVDKEIVTVEDTGASIPATVVIENNGETNHVDIHQRLLNEKVKAKKQSRNKTGNDAVQSLDKKKQELLNKINQKMKDYREECSELNVSTWLNEHGNDLYQSLKDKKNGIDYQKIKENNVIYISKFFDVLDWWKIKETTYPELAVGACIVLGKPTHNAFQERVFSRGTYTDSKLRKQLKEESFEMSVLNSVNSRTFESCSDMIDTINNKIYSNAVDEKKKEEMVAEEVEKFIATREHEPRYDADIVEDSISPENKDEVISVCSENTYDYDFDEEDDDEIFNQVLAKNWVNTNNETMDIETITLPTKDNNNKNVVECDESNYL